MRLAFTNCVFKFIPQQQLQVGMHVLDMQTARISKVDKIIKSAGAFYALSGTAVVVNMPRVYWWHYSHCEKHPKFIRWLPELVKKDNSWIFSNGIFYPGDIITDGKYEFIVNNYKANDEIQSLELLNGDNKTIHYMTEGRKAFLQHIPIIQ